MLAERDFEELRPRAFAIAYRMLGSVSEAEDVVQEALLRLHKADESGERISSPRSWLATVVTRLALDELRSARARREQYVGEWIPEPVMTASESEPAAQAELAESLSFSFLVLLESLTPEQRAVFLLHDVFDYPYAEVASTLDKSADAVRQLAVRARRQVSGRRPRYEASSELHDQLADRFFAAAQEGELAALQELLAEDVVLHGDGGGKVPALARALEGRERVAKTLVNWTRAGARVGGLSYRRVTLNGQPGALGVDPEGRLITAMAVDVLDGRITQVRSVINPAKLTHLGEVIDWDRVLGRG